MVIHDIFHLSLLEQDLIKKAQVVKLQELEQEESLDIRNDKQYKIEIIYNSKIYPKKKTIDQLQKLYYLVSWKSYREEKNTWEPVLVVIYLCKMINTFYKNYLDKLIEMLPPLDFALPIAKLTTKSTAKPTNITNKE